MSPARARTSRSDIVAAARDMLEDGGLEAVSMAGVAVRVGVRPPSLYKHFRDRNELIGAIATDVALELGRTFEDAVARCGPSPADRVRALASAYRGMALARPRATALLFAGISPDATPSAESQAAAARPILAAADAIVGPAQALAAARVLTAFAHGFTSMEAAGAFRFGGDVDEAYLLGVAVLLAGLEQATIGGEVSRR
jgi:AcrR family transcriptional regulator